MLIRFSCSSVSDQIHQIFEMSDKCHFDSFDSCHLFLGGTACLLRGDLEGSEISGKIMAGEYLVESLKSDPSGRVFLAGRWRFRDGLLLKIASKSFIYNEKFPRNVSELSGKILAGK